jgi:cysteinyl-tRNA synthetase
MKARDEKKAEVAAKAAQKEAARAAQQQKQLEKLQQGKLKPEEMFKPPNVPEGTYGSWNENGLPLTDSEGQELSKGKSKKLIKEQEEQTKKHQAWLAYLSQQGGPSGGST